MEIKVFLANNTEYSALEDTLVYPSGVSNVRNHMEIHFSDDSMSVEDFVALMSNPENLSTIRVVKSNDNGGVEYDNTYTHYVIPKVVGKKRIDKVDNNTAVVTSEYHLVAVIEQLTYIEQKLAELGVM